MRSRRGFTMIELIMSLAAAAVIMVAIYGVFSKAIKLRDKATLRTREAQVMAHAVTTIRTDLRNALISGGKIAAILGTTSDRSTSRYPGYLKLTTTTALDDGDVPQPDVQQVEYYLTSDEAADDRKAGMLVRATDRTLLAPVRETPVEEPLLAGIESMEVEFYDGSSWQTSWEITEEDKTLPKAIRIRLQRATDATARTKPAPIEIVVPWGTASLIETPITATGGTQG